MFDIQKEFESVSMASFIQQYAPSCKPLDVQIALYVQGLRFHDSKSRKNGLPSLSNSIHAIQEIAKEERLRIYNEKVRQALSEVKVQGILQSKAIAIAIRLQKQQEFFQVHEGVPKLFSYKEIGELNQSRPPEVQHNCLQP